MARSASTCPGVLLQRPGSAESVRTPAKCGARGTSPEESGQRENEETREEEGIERGARAERRRRRRCRGGIGGALCCRKEFARRGPANVLKSLGVDAEANSDILKLPYEEKLHASVSSVVGEHLLTVGTEIILSSSQVNHSVQIMSASEFKISYQQVSSSQSAQSSAQWKTCRCGEGNTSETGDSPPTSCPNCQILKSGSLLLSSKGIGWTVWKKRWFILTRTSLVFFRSDPTAPLPRGSEPIVTLGGIDLNNTGRVVVKEERKLLTVLFSDGHDGRILTLKAETTEDLNDWRSALENALTQAPSIVNTTGPSSTFSTDATEPVQAEAEQSEDHFVIGRPAEFALVNADGSPSFLEKALKFVEDYGVKVEGILRQSADVEEVKRRVRDYEKGKNEFSPEEDAHVIGDCIKYVLREMPSSPVPASCCTALVRAYRTDKARRLDAMNKVIYEVFPEPNRRLLQRVLKMMQIVGSHKAVNRMSQSALAACMAPLLLRPLLLGECDIDNDFSMAGDGSFQLLQAAAAANNAQAIVIIMLEEYDQIFDDIEDGSSEAYTESDSGSCDSGEDDIEEGLDDNAEHSSGGDKCVSNIRIGDTDTCDKVKDTVLDSARNENNTVIQPCLRATSIESGVSKEDSNQVSSVPQVAGTSQLESNNPVSKQNSCGPNGPTDRIQKSNAHSSSSRATLLEKSGTSSSENKSAILGCTLARKDISKEETDCCNDDDDDEAHIKKLENNRGQLHSKITEEVKENVILQASLERRKEALHERRLALEKEVENLRDQLQNERNLRASLESGLMNMRRGQVSFPSKIDSKTKADLEEVATAETDIMNLKQKISDLRGQLNSQVHLSFTSLCESCNKRCLNTDNLVKDEQNATHCSDVISSVEAPPIASPTFGPGMVLPTDMADMEQSRKHTTQYSPPSIDKPAHLKQAQSSDYKRDTSSGDASTVQPRSINKRAQKMLSSKGEILKDSLDGSVTSMWNFAQRQYSSSQLVISKLQSNAYSSTKTEESGVAPSTLAKLTNRLNFLKERRALLASEMQNLDLTRSQEPTAPKRESR
ncbi:hypothetical protein EJB05_07293, partial [Eragrostis curvula]